MAIERGSMQSGSTEMLHGCLFKASVENSLRLVVESGHLTDRMVYGCIASDGSWQEFVSIERRSQWPKRFPQVPPSRRPAIIRSNWMRRGRSSRTVPLPNGLSDLTTRSSRSATTQIAPSSQRITRRSTGRRRSKSCCGEGCLSGQGVT